MNEYHCSHSHRVKRELAKSWVNPFESCLQYSFVVVHCWSSDDQVHQSTILTLQCLCQNPIMPPFCLSRVPPMIEAASVLAKASKWTQKAQEQCIFISLLHTPENRLIADPPLKSLISENSQLLHGSGNCLMKEEGILLGSSSVLTVALNLEQNHK